MPLITMPKSSISLNKSEKSVLKKLKHLYLSEASMSYLYIEPKIKNLKPDFILIDPLRGVMIIEVKAWSIDYIDTINDKEVISIKGDRLENPLSKARRYFNTLQGIFRFYDALFDKTNTLKIKLHSIIAFTEMKEEEAQNTNITQFFEHYPARVLYKDYLTKITLDTLFNNEIEAIQEHLVNTIRIAIFPEIKISKPSEKSDDFFSDKEILALDIEQERFAKSVPLGHYIITGIPGSGKTVALLSRSIYLAKLHPEWKILILTYNKALTSQLYIKIAKVKEDLKVLDIFINNIEICTFHQKANALSSLSASQFQDKEAFWRDILPNDAIKQAKPNYHAILVDEYQDFYSNWFHLILKLLIEHQEEEKSYKNLFLAGDRLQGIYNPKDINWKQDIGLDMRGRAKLLKTSYRNTKEHIKFGLSLLSNDKKYKKEVELFYEGANNILFKNNTKKSIELLKSDYKGIAELFQTLLKSYTYKDILLLAPTWAKVNMIKRFLPQNIQVNINSTKNISSDKSIFTTYHSAKGIEAKVAIIIDIQSIKERKLLYVASTRASVKLILHIPKNQENTLFSQEICDLLNPTSTPTYTVKSL